MRYSDKLKDPRWQKKRLEILQRDEFTCQYCHDKDTTLHIHHYEYSGEPWEAHVDNLETVCEHCHAVLEYNKTLLNDYYFNISKYTNEWGVDILIRVKVYDRYKNGDTLFRFFIFVYSFESKKLICQLDIDAKKYQWLINNL